jgi:hypothetical protein
MPDTTKESNDDRESRLLLIKFLALTDPLLDRLLHRLVLDFQAFAGRTRQNLQQIWTHARRNLNGVIDTITIGLNQARRDGLRQVGMFGEALRSKFDLLMFDFREGAVKRILKRLNSMFSSLAKVFPSLHAVKEFKDHVEATVEGLRDTPEFIDLKDLIEEQ